MRTRKATPAPSIATALAAGQFPAAGQRCESMRVSALALDVKNHRLTLAQARAEIRRVGGAA